MSGGVDSSVVAALLKKRGHNIIGVFMKFWVESKKDEFISHWNRCCSLESENRARQVANILDIPFYVFNFEKEFKKKVVDYFLKEYKEGRTPNPCVVCNKEIKFGLLLEKALSLNIDYVATGHYVQSQQEKNKIQLFRGKDKIKDQSYFLWQLNQKQLRHILFPLGKYTKTQVKKLAKKFKLPVINIPESQEICFVQGELNSFLERNIKIKPGKILNIDGKKIGEHKGLPFYTIGQRKGIRLSGGPFYVVDKDLKNLNWISDNKLKNFKVNAQIRYGHKPVIAYLDFYEQGSTIFKKTKNSTSNIKVIFNKPQRAITPGQSIVFYSPAQISKKLESGKNEELLGGGIIK